MAFSEEGDGGVKLKIYSKGGVKVADDADDLISDLGVYSDSDLGSGSDTD